MAMRAGIKLVAGFRQKSMQRQAVRSRIWSVVMSSPYSLVDKPLSACLTTSRNQFLIDPDRRCRELPRFHFMLYKSFMRERHPFL